MFIEHAVSIHPMLCHRIYIPFLPHFNRLSCLNTDRLDLTTFTQDVHLANNYDMTDECVKKT